MKIKEVLDDLTVTGNTIAKIAKDKASIGEKKLKEALHNAGYEYRNKNPKGWFYAREGEEPLYKSVFDFIEPKTSSSNVKRDSHAGVFDVKRDSHLGVFNVNNTRTKGENPVHTEFTPEEIAILRELIRGYVLDDQQDRDALYQRVVTLKSGKKVRKTIIINEEVGALLDKFAEHQKFNKSDLMEIAILDLIKKYSERGNSL
jgi:predicted DNA-binding antitoxin AbrB/MazE fold protein